LTGFSLGMNIFHFEAFPLSAWKSRFQATDLHKFGLVGNALAHMVLNVCLTLKRDCGLRQTKKVQKSYHHIIILYISMVHISEKTFGYFIHPDYFKASSRRCRIRKQIYSAPEIFAVFGLLLTRMLVARRSLALERRVFHWRCRKYQQLMPQHGENSERIIEKEFPEQCCTSIVIIKTSWATQSPPITRASWQWIIPAQQMSFLTYPMCVPRSEQRAIDSRVELKLKIKETLGKTEFEVRGYFSVGEIADWMVTVLERSLQRKGKQNATFHRSL
jgi:hypothetical protein